jgi:hypothetical protein
MSRVLVGSALLALLLALSCSGATFFLTVTGIGGEPDYDQRFAGWTKDLEALLRSDPEARVETLRGGEATRAKLETALKGIAQAAKPEDTVVVTLIGHGTFDGEYKFNLAGPDITGADLAALMDRIPAKQQLVVVTTSASGGSLAALRKPGRAVVVATKNGYEKNATVFARYWVEALRDPGADTDKNEVISAAEAFRYAERKTADFYKTQNRIATEHPMLEDTGTGEGTRTPGPESGQGVYAGRIALMRLAAAPAGMSDPAKQALYRKKEKLEEDIDKLKFQKAGMLGEEYRKKMNALLLELARTQAEIDK